jgi:hypothetical protein
MKKLNLKAKLSLNKETVTKLTDVQMNSVNGGGPTPSKSCVTNFQTVFVCTSMAGCYVC